MGHNDMQCLAEAICLHMLLLILLVSVMGGCPNEVHSVMEEAENTINCPQDPKNGRRSNRKVMNEENDKQAKQTGLLL